MYDSKINNGTILVVFNQEFYKDFCIEVFECIN